MAKIEKASNSGEETAAVNIIQDCCVVMSAKKCLGLFKGVGVRKKNLS